MLDAYRAVFRAPGTAAFCAAGFVLRLPIALYPIGLVLAVSARDGRYGFAGVLSAAYILGGVPGGPLLGRWIDRFGQRAMLVPAGAVHLAAVAVLTALFELDAPDVTLLAPAVVAGFASLPSGSMVRARWSLTLAGRPELSTAYSLESTLDEVIFVLGPLVATVLATTADPALVFVVAMVVTVIGGAWLFTQRATEPPRRPPGAPPHPAALRQRGMPLLAALAITLGVIFASAEVTMVAFVGQHGERPLTGVVVALFAAGSGTAGFVYGTVAWRVGLLDRFRVHAIAFGAMTALFLVAWNVASLAVAAFLIGTTIAPTLITAFSLVERLVPSGSLTEGLGWVFTGLNIGYGAGAAVVGGIADAHGARTAFLVTVGAGIATAALAAALHRRLVAGWHEPGPGGAPDATPDTLPSGATRDAVAPSQHAALP
jgi:MFS family permease